MFRFLAECFQGLLILGVIGAAGWVGFQVTNLVPIAYGWMVAIPAGAVALVAEFAVLRALGFPWSSDASSARSSNARTGLDAYNDYQGAMAAREDRGPGR